MSFIKIFDGANHNNKTTVELHIHIHFHDDANLLQIGLIGISNQSLNPRIEWFELTLIFVHITPLILALLVQILSQPLHKAPTGEGLQWDQVELRHCTFARPGTTHLAVDDEDFCSQEDIQIFASTLARRTSRLALFHSPEILECIFNTPHLELKELSLGQRIFSGVECARIGDLVQRCGVSLEHLDIQASDFEEPLVFGQGLAIAFQQQSVCFSSMVESSHECALADVLVRDGVDGIMGQLLSPPSRLQELNLQNLHLQDHHFQLIVESLLTSQLQVLDVSHNHIGRDGILAFAQQLPRIKCLKKISLYHNRWGDWDQTEVIPSLLLGLFENYAIELLGLDGWREELKYCTHANWVRRQILAAGNATPIELWPLILESVGKCESDPTWDEDSHVRSYMASTLYFMLQNSPIASSYSLRSSR